MPWLPESGSRRMLAALECKLYSSSLSIAAQHQPTRRQQILSGIGKFSDQSVLAAAGNEKEEEGRRQASRGSDVQEASGSGC